MTLYNNATIYFTHVIPETLRDKCNEIVGADESAYFKHGEFVSALVLEDAAGDWMDTLNELVALLKPYGVVPNDGEANRYYGDDDGYDVFTGEQFVPMSDEEYGVYALPDKTLVDMLRERGYTVTVEKNGVSCFEEN